MSDTLVDPGAEAAVALAEACRANSTAVLSDPQALQSFLGTFAATHPSEAALLTSAAEVDVAGMLVSHVGANLDLETAVLLTSTALKGLVGAGASASRWATLLFAGALGYDVSALAPATISGAPLVAPAVGPQLATPAAAVPAAGAAAPAPSYDAASSGPTFADGFVDGGEPATEEPVGPPAAWAGLIAGEKAATAAQRQQADERREREERERRERREQEEAEARAAVASVAIESGNMVARRGSRARRQPRMGRHYTSSGKPVWIAIVAAIITYLLGAAAAGLPPFGSGKAHNKPPTTTTTVPPSTARGGSTATTAQRMIGPNYSHVFTVADKPGWQLFSYQVGNTLLR